MEEHNHRIKNENTNIVKNNVFFNFHFTYPKKTLASISGRSSGFWPGFLDRKLSISGHFTLQNKKKKRFKYKIIGEGNN
jgi:hypothetical protein